MAILADILVGAEWTNLNTISGISNWNGARIQNKSSKILYLATTSSGSTPPAPGIDGYAVAGFPHRTDAVEIPANSVTVWARSSRGQADIVILQY